MTASYHFQPHSKIIGNQSSPEEVTEILSTHMGAKTLVPIVEQSKDVGVTNFETAISLKRRIGECTVVHTECRRSDVYSRQNLQYVDTYFSTVRNALQLAINSNISYLPLQITCCFYVPKFVCTFARSLDGLGNLIYHG